MKAPGCDVEGANIEAGRTELWTFFLFQIQVDKLSPQLSWNVHKDGRRTSQGDDFIGRQI